MSRLHRWDLRADAWLGACLALGFSFGGYLSLWAVGPLLGFLSLAWLFPANPAPLALAVGTTFGLFVWSMTVKRQRAVVASGCVCNACLGCVSKEIIPNNPPSRARWPAVFGMGGPPRTPRSHVRTGWTDPDTRVEKMSSLLIPGDLN